VSHFSLILIKKRIKMMNKISKSGWLSIKSLLIPVAFVAALVLTSFTVELGVNHTTGNNDAASLATFQKQPTKNKVTPLVIQKEDDEPIFQAVEQMPSYPGGTQAMIDFLGKNTSYPEDAIKKGIQGTVYVQFIVEKNGSISNIKVIRGVHPSLDAEAIRVTKLMANWTPGKQNGHFVRVAFTMPVKFLLEGDKKANANENTTTVNVGTSGMKISGDYPDNIVFIINGKVSTKDEANTIDPDKIKSINIIKNSTEIAKYGDKSKNGIMEITLKEGVTEANMKK
jgi:TonB family protein